MKTENILLIPLNDFPVVRKKDDINYLIDNYLYENNLVLKDGDIIVVAQKIISIAEDRIVDLKSIVCTDEAYRLSEQTGREPELCQAIINESLEIMGVKGRNIITRHKLGYVCTNAGIDSSNVAPKEEHLIVLLPNDPDESAHKIRNYFEEKYGTIISVIICDSFGREFRHGSVGEAIGVAGINPITEKVGKDIFGNAKNPKVALVDDIAAAASILMGELDERIPVVLVRGVSYGSTETDTIKSLLK